METILEILEGSVKIVQFNKPKKKNAIDCNMYERMINIFQDAAVDDNITTLVLTGTGDFYSSGNDFSTTEATSLNRTLREFFKAFITFPKLIVAIVNGPAIGVAATTLALCDLVFASENSYFYTPFSKLGIVAEGCSTFTFPRIIGQRKAIEMLICNYKMSAKEALDCGFINYIYKPNEIQSTVWDKIVLMSKLPKHSVVSTKKLIKDNVKDELLKVNEREMDELHRIWSYGSKSKI